MKRIRTLNPGDIELRVADKNNKGEVHMLAYITSRSATNLLDETYGPENYNIEYVDVAGQIYCKLSVWDEETQRYVIRMDTGEEAKIAADKSLASDALKRTIVRLGCTELYSGPSIYIPDDGYGNKGYQVSEIDYDDNRNIVHLVIVNRFGKEAFRWDKNVSAGNTTPKSYNAPKTAVNTPSEPVDRENDIKALKLYCRNQYDYYKGKEMWAECTWIKEFGEWYIDKLQKGEWQGEWNTERVLNGWIDRKRRTPAEQQRQFRRPA